MVIVFLANGARVTLNLATKVQVGHFADNSTPTTVDFVDQEGNVVAKFKATDVMGYYVGADSQIQVIK